MATAPKPTTLTAPAATDCSAGAEAVGEALPAALPVAPDAMAEAAEETAAAAEEAAAGSSETVTPAAAQIF